MIPDQTRQLAHQLRLFGNRPKLDVLTILAKRAGLIGVTRQEVASTDAAGGPRCPALGAAALEAAHP